MDGIKLEAIENDRKLSPETDPEFFYEYQKGVLLALLESGKLTQSQYQYAEEKLRQQKYNNIKQQQENASDLVNR